MRFHEYEMTVRLSLVGLAALAALACTRNDPRPLAVPEPNASAAAPAATSVVAAGASSPPAAAAPRTPPPSDSPDDAKAWTDAPVTRALAKDCKYAPPEGKPDEPNVLSCALGFEQSCAYDPCFETDQSTCKPKCKKGCDGCAAACVSGCEGCKKKCGDDACRAACGDSCGECRQACLVAKDRCTTGTCAGEYTACRKKLGEAWRKSSCAKACPVYTECSDACRQGTDEEKCREGCKKKMGSGCSPSFLTMCIMGSAPTGGE